MNSWPTQQDILDRHPKPFSMDASIISINHHYDRNNGTITTNTTTQTASIYNLHFHDTAGEQFSIIINETRATFLHFEPSSHLYALNEISFSWDVVRGSAFFHSDLNTFCISLSNLNDFSANQCIFELSPYHRFLLILNGAQSYFETR